MKPDIVMPSYNPSYLGGRGRRFQAPGQPGQKCETLPRKKTNKQKQTEHKRAGSEAQVREKPTA
jgi:hypothetical protein